MRLDTKRAMVTRAVFAPVYNYALLKNLIVRDFSERYRGSLAGIGWTLIMPIVMLAVYTFVFRVAFNARWGAAGEDQLDFAIVLFSGLIIHTLFSECISRAPALVSSRPNYVKKVVFPLEILPWVSLGSSLGHFMVSFVVLIIFCLVTGTPVHPGALLMPVVLLPLVLVLIGLGWILSSLGTYIKDLAHLVGPISTVTLFLSPVFYKIEILPPVYQTFILWNPITFPVTNLRALMFLDGKVDWMGWLISLFVSAGLFVLGAAWFQKTRKGFADVL